ncbi:MAG: hypothetical protein QXK88_06325 [Desulfurococcaceae archaeon]
MADIGWILNAAISNPQLAVVILVQFFLGLALGYVALKAFKYILALLAILALGAALSVWSLGITPSEVLSVIGLTVESINSLIVLLGLTTMGPVTLGFIIGALASLVKK